MRRKAHARSILSLVALTLGFLTVGHSLCAQQAGDNFFDRRPYLQSLTSSSVLIVSQSTVGVLASVRYGTDAAMDVCSGPTVAFLLWLWSVPGDER